MPNVFRNCEAHKNQGRAYVTEGFQQKEDVSQVKCFRCNQMGHYKSDCPKQKSSGGMSGSASSEKKKKTTINWSEVAPANGGLQMLKKKICV